MINIKTEKEIKYMKKGGHILHEVLMEVMRAIKPGVTELEIDKLAEKLIREKGGEPGFKKVKGYDYSVCMSTNDVVVHGIPGNYVFKEGDVVGVDCGVFYEGLHTDMAETIIVPAQKAKSKKQKDNIDKFLAVGSEALDAGIAEAVIGKRIGHIGRTIQDIVEKQNGYSIVRSLIGHGVGHELHEEPEVPGYLIGRVEDTPKIREGMTIAVEVIYNMGKKSVSLDKDGWTIRTSDGTLAGLFERSILITKEGPILLTV